MNLLGLRFPGAADGVRLLSLVADILIGSFRPQLLAIDDRLGQIQLLMIAGAALSLLLVHRLERRLKADRIGQ